MRHLLGLLVLLLLAGIGVVALRSVWLTKRRQRRAARRGMRINIQNEDTPDQPSDLKEN
jgi:Tfp pilus assembly protein PilX